MKTVKELADYLGVKLEEAQIESLISFVDFDNMKSYIKTDDKFILEEGKGEFEFFKNGKIGTWKKYLSKEMSSRIDEIVKLKLTYRNKDLIRYEPTKIL